MCHKQGHFRKDCPDRFKHGDKGKNIGEVYVAQEGYQDVVVLCVAELKSDQSWILDNGCSFHMTSNKN